MPLIALRSPLIPTLLPEKEEASLVHGLSMEQSRLKAEAVLDTLNQTSFWVLIEIIHPALQTLE